MLSKETKIRILENFYALDYMFFGKPIKKVETVCPICIEEYITVKGALMSTVTEMYDLIGHAPSEMSDKVTTEQLHSLAKSSATLARENATKLIQTDKCKAMVQEEVKTFVKENVDADIDPTIAQKLKEKAFSLGIDNLLVARALTESEDFSKLDDWAGRFLEDAYKTLRENLVDSAMDIINIK